MSLQDNHVHFFEKLSSDLGFSPAPPSIQDIMNSLNSFVLTYFVYKNVSSGETLEGSFFIEKSFLICYQVIHQ